MALPLPLLTSGEIAFVGVALPKLTTGQLAASGVVLPKYTTGEIAFAGIGLPDLITGEAIPSLFALVATGGTSISGSAHVIPFDPFFATGGMLVGGIAPMTYIVPTLTDWYPLGGAYVGGAAPVVTVWLRFVPSGGAQVGGVATVITAGNSPVVGTGGVRVGGEFPERNGITYTLSGFPDFAPNGGIRLHGDALVQEVILFVPTGGTRLGGAAIVANAHTIITTGGGTVVGGSAVVANAHRILVSGGHSVGGSAVVRELIPFTATGGVYVDGTSPPLAITVHTPSGGVLVDGVAPNATVGIVAPSGGIVLTGAATTADRQAFLAAGGGARLGGAAPNVYLLAGTSITAENPTNALFPTWVMNYDTSAISRYTDFPITSLCMFNGKTYVTTAAGVYSFDGATDVGRAINARITLANIDFNTSRVKSMAPVYVGYRGTGGLKLTVSVNRQTTYSYPISNSDAAASKTKGAIAKIGQGLSGRYWQFAVTNTAGADFDIESIEMNPIQQQRHRA